MITDSPALYNSRIFQTYIDYLCICHPDVNIDSILQKSQMTKDEVSDSAHWFTQEQADRFYQVVMDATGDDHIARQAGRYSASSKGLNLIKQYVIGLLSIETAFMSLAKIVPLLTRGATVRVKKLGANRIEITSEPTPGVAEKFYQCENRLGAFEAIPRLFTNVYARIEHPLCLHKGHHCCRYIVCWEKPASLYLKRLRNYLVLGGLAISPLLLFFTSVPSLLLTWLFLFCLLLFITTGYHHQKIRELEKIIESHHQMAEEQIEWSNKRYSNSLLVQEIGQATAAIFNIDELINQLAVLMSKRLAFDRGIIMLADENHKQLTFSAGYGYLPEEQQQIQSTIFCLDSPDSKGIFVRAFLDQKYVVVNDMNEIGTMLSCKSRQLTSALGVRAILCVPIVYKDTSLGIVAVDNIKSKTPLEKSDINLLQGIASQIAISINNARSFQRLQHSEHKYRQTLENIGEGYFEINLAGKIQFANKALGDLLGYGLNDILDSHFIRFFTPEAAKKMDPLLDEIKQSGQPIRFAHFELLQKNQKVLPVDLSVSLILDNTGAPSGFRGLLRDAKDRLQLEMERTRLENQLLKAQKMEAVGTLAGGIAHNFNNWLTGILGNITLIRLGLQKNEKVLERIHKIENIIENAAKMTQQLLGYARGGKYESRPIDINQIVRESGETFGAAKKDTTIKLELDPALYTVKADRSQIEQVLWNLYVNAVDAMPDGGEVHIQTKNTTAGELSGSLYEVTPGAYACIRVRDTGSGIDPEHIENIFEPFYTTKTGKGTGLGLASAYGIIKSHKGYIDVKSTKNRGSTFTILLPAIDESPQLADAPSQLMPGNETILLVDDEAMVLDTSEQLLSSLGYTIITATSGDEALKIYKDQRHAIDLVILDMVMPKMSGSKLHSRLREFNPGLKTLLASGYSMNETAKAIMDQGCNGFIQKPFNLVQISALIRQILAPACQTD